MKYDKELFRAAIAIARDRKINDYTHIKLIYDNLHDTFKGTSEQSQRTTDKTDGIPKLPTDINPIIVVRRTANFDNACDTANRLVAELLKRDGGGDYDAMPEFDSVWHALRISLVTYYMYTHITRLIHVYEFEVSVTCQKKDDVYVKELAET